MAYDAAAGSSKAGIPPFPFPSPLRQQIKASQLVLGTATPATSE